MLISVLYLEQSFSITGGAMGRHHCEHDVRIEEEGEKTPSSDRSRRGRKSRSSNDKSYTTKERNSSSKRKRKRRGKDDNVIIHYAGWYYCGGIYRGIDI